MIFFRVTQNINIKTTDGTLVKYHKFKIQPELKNDTVYISTFKDFEDLKDVFISVDKNKYMARLIKENKVREQEGFPLEVGICNAFEHTLYQNFKNETRKYFVANEQEIKDFSKDLKKADLLKQVSHIKKEEISLVLIGASGHTIGQMVASCTAIRIMYEKLKEVFSKVNIDICLNASNNTFYSRDRDIFENQSFIRQVRPLSLSLKEFFKYDCFIDNSSFVNSSFFKDLNYIDQWLYRFGIDYKSIKDEQKYNQLNLTKYTPKDELVEKLKEAKSKAKLLLFHPYSATLEKSIPQSLVSDFVNKLVKYDDYIIVTTLEMGLKSKDNRILDLKSYSKNFNDFAYIISHMDKIITVDTSTYHISDAFMVPTLVLSPQDSIEKDIKYYHSTRAIKIQDKSKDLSKFIFKNKELTLYKYSSWNKIKVSKLIKLLENL